MHQTITCLWVVSAQSLCLCLFLGLIFLGSSSRRPTEPMAAAGPAAPGLMLPWTAWRLFPAAHLAPDYTYIYIYFFCAGKRCFVPLVKDTASNMQLLHIGRLQVLATDANLSLSLSGSNSSGPLAHASLLQLHCLHSDDPSTLVAAPPFGILEPTIRYPDGRPREDGKLHTVAGSSLLCLYLSWHR